jgi:hypothetical protein
MKSIFKKIVISLGVLLATVGVGVMAVQPVFADESKPCTSILTFIDCDAEDGEGIMQTIRWATNIVVGVLGVAATIGIIYCGVLWMTARDDAAQVAKARKRIIEIAIGLAALALIEILITFIVPGGDTMGIGANG